MVVYFNTLSFGHALDDDIVIVNNIFTVKGIKGIPDILNKDSFHGFFKKKKNLVSGGRYRPLSLITFSVESELFGKELANGDFEHNAKIGHAINIILYGFCCLMVIKLLSLLFYESSLKSQLFILSTSLFFALHPIHTEVIANIKGRDEILSFLFAICALYLIIKKEGGIAYLLISSILLFLSLLSKENGITFLAVIPIALYFFKGWTIKKVLSCLYPLIIAVAAYLYLRHSVIGFSVPSGYCEILNDPFCNVSNSDKYATVLYTWIKYWMLLLFPIDLTHDYYPKHIKIRSWADTEVIISLIVNLTSIAFAFYGLHKRKIYGFALCFYWICFSIVSNLLFNVGTLMNERFVFFSSLGYCMLASIIIWEIAQRIFKERSASIAFCTICLVISFLYGFKTWDRNYAWKDNLTLFRTDVKVSINSIKCNTSYGGKLSEYANTIKDPVVRTRLIEESIKHLHKAIKLYPGHTAITSWNLMGKSYAQIKKWGKSRWAFNTCLKINPNYPEAKQNMEYIGQQSYINKDYNESKIIYKDLAQINKHNRDIYYNKLGQIYGQHLNQIDSAIFFLNKAIEYNDKNVSALENIGVAYSVSGNFNIALKYFKKALSIKPKNAKTHLNLGLTYKNLGQDNLANKHLSMYNELKEKK